MHAKEYTYICMYIHVYVQLQTRKEKLIGWSILEWRKGRCAVSPNSSSCKGGSRSNQNASAWRFDVRTIRNTISENRETRPPLVEIMQRGGRSFSV